MVGGAAAGVLIDVLTGGMTGGLGTTVIGPMIGSALGAFFGNKAAAAEKTKPLTEARQAATVATLKYDQKVKEATERANGRFEARRIAAQSKLTALADDLSLAWARSSSAATRDMLGARGHLNDAAKDALAQARNEVGRPRGVFAYIRRHRWSQAADESAGTPARLDTLLAHRQGRTKARMIVDDFARRRAVILASLAHAADDMTALALAGRLEAARDIRELREDLGEEVREVTGSALATLWESTNLVRAELVATGTKTPEWVEENFPPVPRPH